MRILFTVVLIIATSLTIKAQDILSFVDSLMLKNQIPEIGFSVISVDRILELKTLGYHRIDVQNNENKATENDYFHLGSNTKAITGFVAATLVEGKKLIGRQSFLIYFQNGKKKVTLLITILLWQIYFLIEQKFNLIPAV